MKKLPKLSLKAIKKLRIKKPKVNLKKIASVLAIFGAVLLVGSAYVAYKRLYMTDDRRFWLAINNSMATSSVVREVQQGGTGNKQIDKTRFTFGAQATSNKLSSVSQKSATTDSNVTTQTLTTPTEEFVRYLNISTNEKKQDGSEYNFDSIRGIWAVESKATTQEEKPDALLTYVQPHITLVPFGNMSPASRRDIVNELKNSGSYVIDSKSVTEQVVDKETYKVYSVKVQTKKYVAVLQKQLKAIGYGEFPPLNPDNYPENARVNATFLVRKKDNVIAGIQFNGLTERYSNYGVNSKVSIPTDAISLEELQARLQSLQ